jgi:hypothetical protein
VCKTWVGKCTNYFISDLEASPNGPLRLVHSTRKHRL